MRQLVLAAITTALLAGEAAAPPPLVSVAMPDLVRSGERFAGNCYGRMWRLPAVQQLREAIVALPKAEPAWIALLGRIQELQAEFGLPARSGDEPLLRLALRTPPGGDPKVPEGAEARRDGDWWLLASPGALARPAPTAGAASADFRLVIDPRAIPATLSPADAERFRRVQAVLGLVRIEAEAIVTADGIHESILARGCRLPLRPVDPDALRGMPERPLSIFAVGIDGPGLARMVHDMAGAAGAAAGLAAGAADLTAKVGCGLDELLGALDGTLVIAATQGVPLPGMTVSLPASAAADRIVARLIDLAAPGTGAALAKQAAGETVLLPLPRGVPLVAVVRRTATRWLLSTDQSLVEAASAAAPAPFPLAKLWAKPEEAVALGWTDTRAQMQTLLAVMPMAQQAMPDPQLRPLMLRIQGAVAAALPLFQPSSMQARQTPEGVRIAGENSLGCDVLPLPVMAGMLLPAVSLVREQAQRANAGSNMRQICIACLAYGNDFDQAWPPDLDALAAWSNGDLVPKLFQSPGHPEIAHPFLYVRPVKSAKATQPVLVQDPACNKGKGSVACYADGHVAFVKGTALWQEAQRLAALPKAAAGGIEAGDWTMLDGAEAPPHKAAAPAGNDNGERF